MKNCPSCVNDSLHRTRIQSLVNAPTFYLVLQDRLTRRKLVSLPVYTLADACSAAGGAIQNEKYL